jgi:hypothetical protein
MNTYELVSFPVLELDESVLSQIDGGLMPLLPVVFGLAGLTATLINMVDRNPEFYSSGSWYSRYSGHQPDTMETLAAYGP